MDGNQSQVAPKQLLSVPDGIFLIVGMVIGVGIFKPPSTGRRQHRERRRVPRSPGCSAAWSRLCGALVYAELASRHPDTGGEYAFLRRGLGGGAAFLFAWSRMTVIQTGAIAAVAFVFGDYASEIFPLRRAQLRRSGRRSAWSRSPRSTSPARCSRRRCRR